MWVGALLEGVCVDPWGKFKFMLLRVKDRNGRQVLLVRGANNASESKIVEELRKEVCVCAFYSWIAQVLPAGNTVVYNHISTDSVGVCGCTGCWGG